MIHGPGRILQRLRLGWAWGLTALCLLAGAMAANASDTDYSWTNFAGQPGGLGSADGTGSAARFQNTSGVAVDSAGNVFVADF